MVGFFAVKQFQMQVAAGLVGEALEEFTCQAEAKRARHVLKFFFFADALKSKFVQPTPNEVRPAAEIDDASCEAFIHRHEALPGQWIARVEPGSISAQTFLVPERLCEGLAQRDAAVLHRVMRIDFQIAFATKCQIDDGMLREQCQHVIEEWHTGFDRRLAFAINHQLERDLGFFRDALDLRGANFHVVGFKQAQ